MSPRSVNCSRSAKRDRGFRDGAGRKQMVALFGLLGEESELVHRYRRLLASALN